MSRVFLLATPEPLNVRFWPKADMPLVAANVPFGSKADISLGAARQMDIAEDSLE
jgi:hypothetical protein